VCVECTIYSVLCWGVLQKEKKMHPRFVNGKISCTNNFVSCHVLTPLKSFLMYIIALSKLGYLHTVIYTMMNYSSHIQDSVQLWGLALLYKALSSLCPKELNYAEAICCVQRKVQLQWAKSLKWPLLTVIQCN